MATAATATATTATATTRPTKSGPKHKRVRKRTAEYQAKRDARRREAWARKKEGDTLRLEMKIARVGDDAGPSPGVSLGVENALNTQVQAQVQAQAHGGYGVEGAIDTESRTVGGGFLEPTKIEKPRVVPYNAGSAAYIADSEQRLVLYRGYAGQGTEAANTAALAAAAYLTSNSNVGSKTCYFMLYDAGVTYPSHPHTHSFGNIEVGLHAVGLLQPLLNLVNDIFWHRLPNSPPRSVNKPLQFVLDKDGTFRASPTFPFAAFAITMSDAIPEPPNPIDALASGPLAAGLKCIVPFGPSDTQSGSTTTSTVRVSMLEAGIEVEAGPGQPIFIPSTVPTRLGRVVDDWVGVLESLRVGMNCEAEGGRRAESGTWCALDARVSDGLSHFAIVDLEDGLARLGLR
ncbi:hypothetical protein V8D89_002406 [Ganoderma adspersum]